MRTFAEWFDAGSGAVYLGIPNAELQVVRCSLSIPNRR